MLVTAHIAGDYPNPWDDVIDERAGVIRYWGDAKFASREKTCDAFNGNRCLKGIYDEWLVGDRTVLPPILHFSRPSSGRLVFNGLCALETMELTWFEDCGRPIRNYRYGLSILDEEFVSFDWLRTRVIVTTKTALMNDAPLAWIDYVRGRTRRRQLWKARVLTTEAQLPTPGSDNQRILEQLIDLAPNDFEAVIVALFREMKTVEHSITGTRYVNDNGFDFFGSLPCHFLSGTKYRCAVRLSAGSRGSGSGKYQDSWPGCDAVSMAFL